MAQIRVANNVFTAAQAAQEAIRIAQVHDGAFTAAQAAQEAWTLPRH